MTNDRYNNIAASAICSQKGLSLFSASFYVLLLTSSPDNWERFVKECNIAKEWFKELGENEEKKLNRIWNDKLDKKRSMC